MVFWQAVHHIHCYLWVDFGSSCYSFTHSLTYAICPRCTNQRHTSHKNTVCSLFCSSLYTHDDVAFLLRANAGNVSLPGNLFRIQMDSVSLDICHVQVTFCSWDSIIKLQTRTSLNLLCVILPPRFMEQEGNEDGHTYEGWNFNFGNTPLDWIQELLEWHANAAGRMSPSPTYIHNGGGPSRNGHTQ